MLNSTIKQFPGTRGAKPQMKVRRSDLKLRPIMKKLICPTCKSSKSTIYVYADAPTCGHISQKCNNCGHLLYIDYERLTVQDAES